jgi:hypothetical protein
LGVASADIAGMFSDEQAIVSLSKLEAVPFPPVWVLVASSSLFPLSVAVPSFS